MIHKITQLPITGVTLSAYVQDDIGTYGTEKAEKQSSSFREAQLPDDRRKDVRALNSG